MYNVPMHLGKLVPFPHASSSSSRIRTAVFVLVVSASFVFLFLHLCPRVSLYDAGELAVAGAVQGVAHPPGYPSWCLQAGVFRHLGWSTMERRLALSSAVAALALVLAVAVVMRSTPEATVKPAIQSAGTQVIDKPASGVSDATLLARVDQRLGQARTRLTGIDDVSLRYASRRRQAGSDTLLKRTRKLRMTLARHDVTEN